MNKQKCFNCNCVNWSDAKTCVRCKSALTPDNRQNFSEQPQEKQFQAVTNNKVAVTTNEAKKNKNVVFLRLSIILIILVLGIPIVLNYFVIDETSKLSAFNQMYYGVTYPELEKIKQEAKFYLALKYGKEHTENLPDPKNLNLQTESNVDCFPTTTVTKLGNGAYATDGGCIPKPPKTSNPSPYTGYYQKSFLYLPKISSISVSSSKIVSKSSKALAEKSTQVINKTDYYYVADFEVEVLNGAKKEKIKGKLNIKWNDSKGEWQPRKLDADSYYKIQGLRQRNDYSVD